MNPCAVCGHMIPPRPYQAKTARTCSPVCAKTLAVREHPEDVDVRRGSGHSGYWRKRLAEESEKPTPIGEKP